LIREEEPPKPSTRLSATVELGSIAANRGAEPKKLRGLVRGELDWIVMKCLEKDRNRRYETANSLALDLRRYLHDEPVQACRSRRIRAYAEHGGHDLTEEMIRIVEEAPLPSSCRMAAAAPGPLPSGCHTPGGDRALNPSDAEIVGSDAFDWSNRWKEPARKRCVFPEIFLTGAPCQGTIHAVRKPGWPAFFVRAALGGCRALELTVLFLTAHGTRPGGSHAVLMVAGAGPVWVPRPDKGESWGAPGASRSGREGVDPRKAGIAGGAGLPGPAQL
jgi:hypothetical protein